MKNTGNLTELALYKITPAHAESLGYRLEQAPRGLGIYEKANRIRLLCFNFLWTLTRKNPSAVPQAKSYIP